MGAVPHPAPAAQAKSLPEQPGGFVPPFPISVAIQSGSRRTGFDCPKCRPKFGWSFLSKGVEMTYGPRATNCGVGGARRGAEPPEQFPPLVTRLGSPRGAFRRRGAAKVTAGRAMYSSRLCRHSPRCLRLSVGRQNRRLDDPAKHARWARVSRPRSLADRRSPVSPSPCLPPRPCGGQKLNLEIRTLSAILHPTLQEQRFCSLKIELCAYRLSAFGCRPYGQGAPAFLALDP